MVSFFNSTLSAIAVKPYLKVYIVICINVFSANALAQKEQATIIFTSEMTEIGTVDRGGYPELATLLKEYRNKKNAIFFVFGGASIGPSALSSLDRGVHIIDILNSLEPDVMGVTKRDFSFLEDELSLRSYEAAFPFVLSNIIDENSKMNLDGISNSVIIQQNNYKMGVLSIIDDVAASEYGLKQITVLNPQKTIAQQAKLLRQQGADFVMLTYSGSYIKLEDFLTDHIVDFILHKDGYIKLSSGIKMPEHPNYVFLTELDQVAVIELNWQKNQPDTLKLNWHAVSLPSYSKDAEVLKQVTDYQTRLSGFMNERIGLTTKNINTSRKQVRTQENAFGNLIADAAKNYTGADIALINGGTIRGGAIYGANHVFTRGEITKELPFRNKLVLSEISGKNLLLALEWAVSDVDNVKGRFLQVSGIQFAYSVKKPVAHKVSRVMINQKPLVKNQLYKIAMTDYLINGGDGYNMFKSNQRLKFEGQMNKLVSNILIDYIRLKQKVSPVVSGRIIALTN
ncbi:MAG: bifunctional metallophosphatase/5'-nucleotidase [Gammaproteobacteria bacterium]|nr:MAG: bifunctional metallophosphatase/5'-nucleotidase [Gammaproteobacteria bacterium]